MSEDRARDLTEEELPDLPENRTWPPGARLTSAHAAATFAGTKFDNLVPNALLNRYFQGPQSFDEVVGWYEAHLHTLGWPPGASTPSADGTRWHKWTWELESIDLIDRVVSAGSSLASLPREYRGARHAGELPPGWSRWSVTYERMPATPFADESERARWQQAVVEGRLDEWRQERRNQLES